MHKLAIFQGVTTPISDLARAIQDQGWQLGQVQWDKALNAFTAVAISPHGEQVSKYGPDENTAVANTLLAVTRKNHMRTTAQFKVGMWRTNFHERQKEIAEAYRDAPIYDPKAVAAYKALGDDSMHRLHVLGSQLHIEPTNEPHPYKSADDMRKDVHEKRHYYLSRAGTQHPVWTSDQVAAFRAVHDILGHGVAGGHYDWPGRVLAANAHFPLLEPVAQQALFAEAVARPAFNAVYGGGPHKIALFPKFFDHMQSANNPSAHRGLHPSQTTAPVASPEGFALTSNFFSGDDDYVICHGDKSLSRTHATQGSTDQSVQDSMQRSAWVGLPGESACGAGPASPRSGDQASEAQGSQHSTSVDVGGIGGGISEMRRGMQELPRENAWGNLLPTSDSSLGKTAALGNTIDVNKGWESGVDPLPQNAYIHHGDPLEYQASMDNASLIDTGWSKFAKGDGSPDRERMKLAIVNAFRVVLLSPRKDLRWNAIHYQDISNIPGSVDDPKVYWDTLENARRKWNSAQGIDPNAHMIYFKFLKPFEARIAAQHPEKGWEWAKAEAKQVLFNWWTEEQERIQQEDSMKPPEKQRGADEIERRANEALAKRLQLFLKPKDDKTDVQDTQMSMFGSDSWKRRFADLNTATDGMEPKNANGGWVYYHVAPASARESILQHGLDYTKGRSGTDYDLIGSQAANYLWPDIERAQRSKEDHEAEHPFEHEWDIWQVNPNGLQIEPDPYGGVYEGAMRSMTPVPPHALTHIAKTAAPQYNLLTGEEALKYGAFMGSHLKAISKISQHADEILDAALEDVREHDGEGHHFRHTVLQLGVSGVGPKVCSFAWLLLQPMTSQLATIDVHMMDVLGHNYEKEMNNRDYFKMEREFRTGLDAAGYGHMPLGAGQWAMWDYKRTGPGSHQDHSAMRVIDPKPHNEVNWAAKSQPIGGGLATEFKKNWADSVDWWAATKAAREAAGAEWDNTYGKEFKKPDIPYQDLGEQQATFSKVITAYDEPFSYYWDRAMPVGVSLDSKARTLAEHAKADKFSESDYEDWLDDHKGDTRLSDTEFKRFKKKSLKKFERLSKVASVQPVPVFVHPETGEHHGGMPGQSLMEHARLQTGLSTQEVWRLLADEHVHKDVGHPIPR